MSQKAENISQLTVRICFAGDNANVTIPFERMRLPVHAGRDEGGNGNVGEVPLSCEMLDVPRLGNGEPACTLRFIKAKGCWKVTVHKHIGLDKPYYPPAKTSVKHLNEGNRSFSLHVAHGEYKLRLIIDCFFRTLLLIFSTQLYFVSFPVS